MPNIEENVVQLLNSEIKKLTELRNKKRTEITPSDQILLRGAKVTVPELLKNLLNSIGVQDAEQFIKAKNIDVQIDLITEIFSKENIQFEVKKDKVVVKYTGDEYNNLVVLEFQIVNNWISCKSYLLQKTVKAEKEQEALKLLNDYNLSTRHTKACILEDKSVLLLRNDYANFIWDEEDLRDIIIADIVIMLDFYKSHKDSLTAILN